jgi:hypothetical protein
MRLIAADRRPVVRASTRAVTTLDSPAPAVQAPFAPSARPGGHALARATGGTHEIDATGRSTVVFPQTPTRNAPAVTTNGSGPHIGRTIELDPAFLNGGGAEALANSSSDTDTRPRDNEGFDELYDRVLSRLRRDLIVERERRGDLAGPFFRR